MNIIPMTRFSIVLSLLCLPIFAFGQTSAFVVVRGVDAGSISEENMTGGPAQPVEEGDEIRTGPASVAIIAFDDGTRVTMGVESAVTLTSMTGETSIGFELGSLRVRAVTAPLRLESPVGSFRMTGLPAEAEFAQTDGRVEVRVVSGGLTTSDLDPDAVVFLGSRERPSRIRRAGSIDGYSPQLPYPSGWVPNIYITDPRLGFPVGRRPMRPPQQDPSQSPVRPSPRRPPGP